MSTGATLNVDKCDVLTGVNVSANNAGGLVGSAENAEINVGEGVTLTMTGSVTGSVTAGGLFGSYTYSKANEKTFDISKFSGIKMALACSSGDTADSAAVGSVFGLLINSADSAKLVSRAPLMILLLQTSRALSGQAFMVVLSEDILPMLLALN